MNILAQGKIKIYRDLAGEYRFKFIAANGKIVAVSEGYGRLRSCEAGIRAACRVAANHDIEYNVKRNRG